jgi:arsenate reductase (thioredoxin)
VTEERKPFVLFLCVANAARSQMAEALLRHHAGDKFEAGSAGLEPKPIDPMTLEVLREKGIDTSGLRSKGTDEFLGKASVRYAVIVCDMTQRNCPRFFPFTYDNLYWPFEDPVPFVGAAPDRLTKFRAVRDQIDARIQEWLKEVPEGK